MSRAKDLLNHVYAVAKNVYNLVLPSAEVESNLIYDSYDRVAFYKELYRIIDESPTASSCIEKREAYLEADGFSDKKARLFDVGGGKTADELLADIVPFLAKVPGYALLIREDPTLFSDEGSAVNWIRVLPIDKIKEKDGQYIYNPTLGTEKYKASEDVIYDKYKKPVSKEEIQENINKQIERQRKAKVADPKQQGRIWIVYRKRPGRGYNFPVPSAYAAREYMLADARFGKLELTNVDEGFSATTIIETPKLSRKRTKKLEAGKEVEVEDSALDQFDQTMQDMTGADGAKIIHLENENPEQAYKITQLSPFVGGEDVNKKITATAWTVARAWRVPGVLISLKGESGIGDTKQIVDEITLFNSDIRRDQNLITRTLEQLFPQQNDWTLTTLQPLVDISPEVYQKLTDEEIRGLAGFAPLKKPKTDYDQVIQSVSTLSPLVANKVLDSLSATEVRGFVGLEMLDEENVTQKLTGDQLNALMIVAKEVKSGSITQSGAIQLVRAIGFTKPRATQIVTDFASEQQGITPVTPITEAPVIPLPNGTNN